ncbi:hypothetical protein J4E91_003256 [Alternaria rosae]|nr:hypothetical protein J4E91_003256 [Alternaria rosae]
MVQDVFSLHNIVGRDETAFPFSLKDYQKYVFGDDRLAHRLGTDLARAFIPTISNPTDDFAVAVLSEKVPTATHSLRNHFVAYLNRHLIANNATPALKIDFHDAGANAHARNGPDCKKKSSYHIDVERVGSRTLIVLAEIRTSQEREDRIRSSFGERGITTVFAYLASLSGSATTAAISSFLSQVVSPSMRDIEDIAHATKFVMNECFVQFVLGREYAEFCKFIRRQDDYFARELLDHAIGGHYYNHEDYEHNVQFLIWETEAREIAVIVTLFLFEIAVRLPFLLALTFAIPYVHMMLTPEKPTLHDSMYESDSEEALYHLWDLPAAASRSDTHVCHPRQRAPVQYLTPTIPQEPGGKPPTHAAPAPMATAAAGSFITLMFGGNGHSRGNFGGVEKGDPGRVAVYWAGSKEKEIVDVKELTKENLMQDNGFSEESFAYPADLEVTAPPVLQDKGNWQTVHL